MGLKFSPSAPNNAAEKTKLATEIEPITRKIDGSMQSAVAYEVTDILVKPKPSTKSNLTTPMQKALISLQRKKKDVEILPADKGNATVILSKQQYEDKIQEHLSLPAYKKLDKDPTDSIKRKLDVILKKLVNSLRRRKYRSPFMTPQECCTLVLPTSMAYLKYTKRAPLYVLS